MSSPSARDESVETILRRIFALQGVILLAIVTLVIVGQRYPSHLGSLPGSILLGAFGGSLSLLRRLRLGNERSIQRFAASLPAVAMPFVYGGLMAGVAYLLFMSGILTGEGGKGLLTSNLFPRFTEPAGDAGSLLNMKQVLQIRPSSTQDLGKLLVWCFLSGYSETFVAGVLKLLEQRTGAGESRSDS